MPSFQERISHAGVFTTPPSRCLEAALHLNVMRYRVVCALIAARSLPEGGQPLRTLRIADMTEPPLSWLKLGERPGREIVLGQIARPWQRGGERMFPISVEEFRRFGRPGSGSPTRRAVAGSAATGFWWAHSAGSFGAWR